mmetsp:Transcript_12362/g.17110  ORF Transcript_12362/g.17110 Transcript_12362/m.17110 type:complete len:200 (-) Transcript_12362:1194-1793(-)
MRTMPHHSIKHGWLDKLFHKVGCLFGGNEALLIVPVREPNQNIQPLLLLDVLPVLGFYVFLPQHWQVSVLLVVVHPASPGHHPDSAVTKVDSAHDALVCFLFSHDSNDMPTHGCDVLSSLLEPLDAFISNVVVGNVEQSPCRVDIQVLADSLQVLNRHVELNGLSNNDGGVSLQSGDRCFHIDDYYIGCSKYFAHLLGC